MIGIIPNSKISIQDLKLLRQVSNLSISEIKQASEHRKPIRLFEVFGSTWETERIILGKLGKNYSVDSNLPYKVASIEDLEIEEIFTTETLYFRLDHQRQIELETQKNSDLENGFIASPDEFVAHDEDWTICD